MIRAAAAALLASGVWGCTGGPVSNGSGSRGDPLAPPAARVWIADEGVRLRARDVGGADAVEPVRLDAVREEVVAFQVVVEAAGAGDEGLADVRVDVALEPAAGFVVERFAEHYVEVAVRSANERAPAESLGWTSAARPADSEQLGWVPDALVPVDVAGELYPLEVPSGQLRAVWVDVFVTADAPRGVSRGRVRVTRRGAPATEIPLVVDVQDATLPYRAARFFTYYGTYELESRFGARWKEAERSVWTVLHAHHVDAVSSGVVRADAAERLVPAWRGDWFHRAGGYVGPGEGVGPEVVVLGTYGELGEPEPAKRDLVRRLASSVPAGVADVLLYAVDEQCDSERGPGWRALLAGAPDLARVRVAHSCARDPRQQDVDVVLTPAVAYDPEAARGAVAMGKRVWVYNGQLPRAGPMMLDAPLASLAADAWLAVAYGVDRWFLWEATFWNDDNRGGHGPVDPFVRADTFHNADGDRCLYDGLLLYPGLQSGPIPPSRHHDQSGQEFEGRSFGVAQVFPSLRLKSLRRGIQDAGLIALAARVDPEGAAAVVQEIAPSAFSDAPLEAPARFAEDAVALADARARLRALIARRVGETEAPLDVGAALAAVTARAETAREAASGRRLLRYGVAAGLALALGVVLALDGRRRRAAG